MRDSILKKLQDQDSNIEAQAGALSKEQADAKAKRRLEKHKKAVQPQAGKNSRRAVHFREEPAPK